MNKIQSRMLKRAKCSLHQGRDLLPWIFILGKERESFAFTGSVED